MPWRITEDLDEYLAEAGAFLRARPVENTLILSVAESVGTRGTEAYGGEPPVFGWWRCAGRGGAVEGAFLHTPPFPVLLTRMPHSAVTPLVEALHQRGGVPGVTAGTALAEEFATVWHELAGDHLEPKQRLRLYRLAGLLPSDRLPPGAPRVAGPLDRRLLVGWYTAFGVEMDQPVGVPVSGAVDERIGHGGLTLWEVAQKPVSMVGSTQLVAGMVRIGPVYTPPELRGRGFGGALTAEVSRAALAMGADHVLLFADLVNPTSNALYRRLGYRPVEDRLLLETVPRQTATVAADG